MKKKILLILVAFIAVAVGVVGMSAFEAHVINVTAKIENALHVPIEELDFGLVFPQETINKKFTVALSQSFIEASEETGYQWATTVKKYTPGKTKNGNELPISRKDPNKALGEAENDNTYNFVSLGFGGEIILGFDHYIVNGSGNDIEIWVTETSFGDSSCISYPEKIKVYASKYGTNWTLLGEAGCLDSEFDLLGLAWAKYLKLVDVSDKNNFTSGLADGYDLDGVKATSRERLGTVNYMLRQKPKCVDNSDPNIHPQVTHNNNTFACPDGSTMMPLLCPYLSKSEISTDGNVTENDGEHLTAFHGLPGKWTPKTTEDYEVYGKLSVPVEDIDDKWNINLKVPCFKGECAQDWNEFVTTSVDGQRDEDPNAYKADPETKNKIYGCDLWLEVTGIDE